MSFSDLIPSFLRAPASPPEPDFLERLCSGILGDCYSGYMLDSDLVIAPLGCAALSMASITLLSSMPVSLALTAAALSAAACVAVTQLAFDFDRLGGLLALLLTAGTNFIAIQLVGSTFGIPIALAVLLGSLAGAYIASGSLSYQACAFYNHGVIRTMFGYPR